MKSLKVHAYVEEDGIILEEHKFDIPMYETIRSSEVPPEVVMNLVSQKVDEVMRLVDDRLTGPEINGAKKFWDYLRRRLEEL